MWGYTKHGDTHITVTPADMLNNGYRMYNFHFKTLISSLGPKQTLFQERNILEVIYFDGQNQW